MQRLPKSATEITPTFVAVCIGFVAYPTIWFVDTLLIDIAVNTSFTSGPAPSWPIVVAMLAWPVCVVVAAIWLIMLAAVRVLGPGKPSPAAVRRANEGPYRPCCQKVRVGSYGMGRWVHTCGRQ